MTDSIVMHLDNRSVGPRLFNPSGHQSECCMRERTVHILSSLVGVVLCGGISASISGIRGEMNRRWRNIESLKLNLINAHGTRCRVLSVSKTAHLHIYTKLEVMPHRHHHYILIFTRDGYLPI